MDAATAICRLGSPVPDSVASGPTARSGTDRLPPVGHGNHGCYQFTCRPVNPVASARRLWQRPRKTRRTRDIDRGGAGARAVCPLSILMASWSVLTTDPDWRRWGRPKIAMWFDRKPMMRVIGPRSPRWLNRAPVSRTRKVTGSEVNRPLSVSGQHLPDGGVMKAGTLTIFS